MNNQIKCKEPKCKVTMSKGSPIFCPEHNDKNKPSLLQSAKSIKTGKQHKFTYTQQMEEVALAWVKDELTLSQIAKALGLDNTGYRTYAKLALTLKQFIKNEKPQVFIEPLEKDDLDFLLSCNIHPCNDGNGNICEAKILTENDEGAYLDKNTIIKLSYTLLKLANNK